MASVGNVGNGTNEKEAVEQTVEGQDPAGTAKTDVDAETQIAAVLTEMQNASENIAVVEAEKPAEKLAENNQGNFEPSIAVIMQDETTGAAGQQANGNREGQVNLTQDQIEVMQSGQIPSQSSLYSLGNIVLILSPDIMASTGGLTPEQIQQIQESQANLFADNAQEGSAISINLDSTQKEGEGTTAAASEAPKAPTVAATHKTAEATSTTATAVTKEAKEDKPVEKKDEGTKEKSDTEKASTAAKKDADKPAPETTMDKGKTDSTKTTPEQGEAGKESEPAEKKKASTIRPIKKRYRAGQKKDDEATKTADDEKNEEKESEKNGEENKEKEKEGEDKADGDKEDGKEKTMKCPNCSDAFSTKEELEEHSKTHNRRKRGRAPIKHTPETPPVSRPKRAKKPESEQGKEDNSIQCEVCGESFSAENKLRKHLTTHNVNKRLHCDGCKVPFAFQYQLDRHVRRNTGEEPYSCDHCSETFKLRCHFNYHLRLHNPKKIHQCEHCNKTFNTFANLKGHTRIHTGEKPYKCEFCEKAFTEYSSLAKHRRAHTGERPFKCNQCEKSFSQSGGLKVHMRVHTGEKPYKCGECERSFAKGYNLKTHMRTHTGEKPYKCENCSKMFSQHSTLVQHIRRHEGKIPKTKTTTAQQTTGNPETDIVESHEETPVHEEMEAQVIQQAEAPEANVQEQEGVIEAQAQQEVEATKTIETAALVALQHTVPQQPNEVVLNERTEAEQVAALQEATQAIQMLQMQQLVHQVEEVVSQTGFS